MRYYRNVFDLGDLNTALQEAFEIKQDRYKYESLGKHKTCLLIFFNNSLRTRLSTQKAARNLGMDVIVLDVNQGAWKLETERGVIMDGDKSEHLLEAIPVMASYCDIIGVRLLISKTGKMIIPKRFSISSSSIRVSRYSRWKLQPVIRCRLSPT